MHDRAASGKVGLAPSLDKDLWKLQVTSIAFGAMLIGQARPAASLYSLGAPLFTAVC